MLAGFRRRARRGARTPANVTITMRQLHSYIGAFIAPLVLFLAFTGSLQVFSLHEAHGGYVPPPLVVRLSRVHKDQTAALPAARPEGEARTRRGHHTQVAGPSARTIPWAVLALKCFFLVAAVGLTISTLLGLWMAFTYSRRKGLILGLLVAGAVLPVLLLMLQPGPGG
jgi:uncharacterized iron-regulated membrane protein